MQHEGIVKAARTGDLDQVIKIVSRGEEGVNTVSPHYGLTPLHLASLHGHLNVVQVRIMIMKWLMSFKII